MTLKSSSGNAVYISSHPLYEEWNADELTAHPVGDHVLWLDSCCFSSSYSASFKSSWSEALEMSSSDCSPEKQSIKACVLCVMVTVQGPWAQGSPSTCIGIIEHFKISWNQEIIRKMSVLETTGRYFYLPLTPTGSKPLTTNKNSSEYTERLFRDSFLVGTLFL